MARPENDQASHRKISLVGAKTFAVSIPIGIIRQLKLKKGDTVIVRRSANKIIIEIADGSI